jgi:hypothetical protein
VTHESGFELITRNYSAYVSLPSRVFPEDVPEEVASLLPGIAWHLDLSLEGVTPAGLRTLIKAATAIAKSAHGVIDDPQEGTFRLPSGVRRYSKPPHSQRIDVLCLGWWAHDGPLLTEDGLRDLVNALATNLPDALPGRWGLYEPPNHSLAEEGPDGFARFLEEHRSDLVVTRGSPPFLDADFRLDRQFGWHHRLFRYEVPHVLIELDAQLLEQPGWGRHLSGVFAALSQIIEPFYGEARVRKGVDRRMGHIDPESPVHPIRYNWWRGLPRLPPLAAVLGPPYRDLWAAFGSQTVGALSLESDPVWDREQTIPWTVPNGVLQPVDAHWEPIGGGFILQDPHDIAPVWPFESPPGR